MDSFIPRYEPAGRMLAEVVKAVDAITVANRFIVDVHFQLLADGNNNLADAVFQTIPLEIQTIARQRRDTADAIKQHPEYSDIRVIDGETLTRLFDEEVGNEDMVMRCMLNRPSGLYGRGYVNYTHPGLWAEVVSKWASEHTV